MGVGYTLYSIVFSLRRGKMDVLGQVLAQALLGSAESLQRQQVCQDVSFVCVWQCFMHVGMAMFRACPYVWRCFVRVRNAKKFMMQCRQACV